MKEWKEYKAIDFCCNVTDGTHDSPKPKEEGYYLITSKHLKDSGIDFASANKISEEDYIKVIQRSKVEQYDILYSMIGTIGNICQVTEENVEFAVKNMGIFKMGGDILKSKWLYYWLNSPMSKHYVSSRLAGSTQSYLTLNSLREYPILVPSDDITIKKIVSILSSLDDKIEVNRRINEQLEELAQALFKSWFVDFEPFKDGDFVESELGMIPKGWKVGTLGDITSEQKIKVGNRDDVKVLSPITTGDLVLSEEFFTKQVYSKSIAKYLVVKPLDFAYNPARVNIGSLGMNEFDFDGCVSPVYVVFRCKEGYNNFFDLYRKRQSFKDEVISRAIGGVRQTLGYKDFSMISVVYPPIEIVKDFNQTYIRLKDVIANNQQEILHLTTLRDTLLPKLMSGEIDVNEVEL